ncbi:MAG TPA: type II secretion system F family protein [Candidatus Synoicihabitans sp.]|nr:type II secretion system F family protein [Candidatus Synoicihabitans sp.]
MPLSHSTLSSWYQRLAQQLEVGLSFADALRATIGSGPREYDLQRMADLCERGGSIDDALNYAAKWIPEADRLFLSAAAETGRMPRVLHNLATRHAQCSDMITRVTLACLYPLIILHFALLLLPLLGMIDWENGFIWDGRSYLTDVLFSAVPLWLAVVGLIYLIRRASPLLNLFATLLPGFRGFVRHQALANFAFALGNFLEAGLRIDYAWQATGVIARAPRLRRAAQRIDAVIARGEKPGNYLAECRCFPPDFIALYQTGESTGQLERNLLHVATLQQERANRSLNFAAFLYPVVFFLLVTGFVAYHVAAFYGDYLKALSKWTE